MTRATMIWFGMVSEADLADLAVRTAPAELDPDPDGAIGHQPVNLGLLLRRPRLWLQGFAVNGATWWLRQLGLHVCRLHVRTGPRAGEGDRLEFAASGYLRVVFARARRRTAEDRP